MGFFKAMGLGPASIIGATGAVNAAMDAAEEEKEKIRKQVYKSAEKYQGWSADLKEKEGNVLSYGQAAANSIGKLGQQTWDDLQPSDKIQFSLDLKSRLQQNSKLDVHKFFVDVRTLWQKTQDDPARPQLLYSVPQKEPDEEPEEPGILPRLGAFFSGRAGPGTARDAAVEAGVEKGNIGAVLRGDKPRKLQVSPSPLGKTPLRTSLLNTTEQVTLNGYLMRLGKDLGSTQEGAMATTNSARIDEILTNLQRKNLFNTGNFLPYADEADESWVEVKKIFHDLERLFKGKEIKNFRDIFGKSGSTIKDIKARISSLDKANSQASSKSTSPNGTATKTPPNGTATTKTRRIPENNIFAGWNNLDKTEFRAYIKKFPGNEGGYSRDGKNIILSGGALELYNRLAGGG